MKQQKMLNTNKGITLIALVITIIVMLILVAVTISMAVNGGLFEYAGKATQDTKGAITNEQQFANLESNMTVNQLIDKYTNPQQGGSGVIPVPNDDEIFASFDIGETAGTVTAYLVVNGTSEEGETLYDMLIIGNGAVASKENWTCNSDINEINLEEYENKIKAIKISEGVTQIADNAFGYYFVTTITLPVSATFELLGPFSPFFGCRNLNIINYRGTEEQAPAFEQLLIYRMGVSQEDFFFEGTVNYNYKG